MYKLATKKQMKYLLHLIESLPSGGLQIARNYTDVETPLDKLTVGEANSLISFIKNYEGLIQREAGEV